MQDYPLDESTAQYLDNCPSGTAEDVVVYVTTRRYARHIGRSVPSAVVPVTQGNFDRRFVDIVAKLVDVHTDTTRMIAAYEG